jgi:hypothetical protein
MAFSIQCRTLKTTRLNHNRNESFQMASAMRETTNPDAQRPVVIAFIRELPANRERMNSRADEPLWRNPMTRLTNM